MERINRRTFFEGLGLTAAAALLAGCSSDSNTPQISGSAVGDLRKKLAGRVLTPGDTGYQTTGLPANTRFASTRPAVIAECRSEADVATAVRWAVDNGVKPVPRGGGHSYAGMSATDGLLLDLSAINSVEAGPTGLAVTGGAAKNSDVYNKLRDGRLALPGGTCLGVGVGGLVLGGGLGFYSRWAGLTADHLRSTRMVTATGKVVEVNANSHPDLFWACRGATGGQFGVHTQFTFELVEVPSTVTYFRFEWRGADNATAVLANFDKIMGTAPPALNGLVYAEATPVGTDGPRAAIDVVMRGQYMGPRAELEDLVRPVLAAAPTTTQATVQELPYWEAAKIFLEPPAEPHAWNDISRFTKNTLPADLWAKQVDLVAQCPRRENAASGAVTAMGWVGGPVIDSVGRTETSYVHRGLPLLVRPTSAWPKDADPAVGKDLIGWTDAMIAVIADHTPNESYQNFPNLRIKDWQQQYYAENFDRLVEVKAKYDPDNVFTNGQGIPTA
ncbi:MAG: FAD-binding oxidoreductase [Nocardiaceae bacterium]|nr:FAD-binding oxidoreductase [Nocardiaceae bacterium]